jgi:hypothetical protein
MRLNAVPVKSRPSPSARNRITETYKHPKYPRLTLDRRETSQYYNARIYLDGKLRQKSTRSNHLPTAFKLAEDWYKRECRASEQQGRQHPIARLTVEPVVREVYESYLATLTADQCAYAEMKWSPIRDFWRALRLREIGPQTFRDFYSWRRKHSARGVGNHSIHKDVILIRQVLKHAVENEQLDTLPIIPKVGKIIANPRPWLTPDEWKQLRLIALARIEEVSDNARLKRQREDVWDFMRFMVASCCRVGEVRALRFMDCRIEKNTKKQKILICSVTGKTGSREIVALPEAVEIYEDRLKSADDQTALIFPQHHRDGFRELLKSARLRADNKGHKRNLKSLRATAISFAVLAGVDLMMIARNAGTSLTMIDQFYAKRLTPLMSKDALTAHAPIRQRKGSLMHRFRT